jgi:hypothetical protein
MKRGMSYVLTEQFGDVAGGAAMPFFRLRKPLKMSMVNRERFEY